MIISDDFKRIIDEDIEKCKVAISENNKENMSNLHSTLKSKYGSVITGFNDNLKDLFYDTDGSYRRNNLITMQQKLELFKAMRYENKYASNGFANNTVTVNNTNTNNVAVDIHISFSDAREKIENMSALREDEILEIVTKIDELEQIINSTDRKTQKWEKTKEIIKWLADKSVDVGLALLPLILKIG